MTTAETGTTEADIFGRLCDSGSERMSAPVARHVLKLGFGAADTARVHHLAEQCRAGEMTAEEQREYDNYIRVGYLLAILQSKARLVLKLPLPARGGRG